MENKDFITLDGIDVEVVDFNQELADITMTNPDNDWSNKITNGKGDEE